MNSKFLIYSPMFVASVLLYAAHNDFAEIFYYHRLYEDRELEQREEPIIVSLGANCIPAYQALIYGLRSASYPFDWLVSDVEGIIISLKEDFSHFLDRNYCSFTGNWIIDSYSKISFLHEFHELDEKADIKHLDFIKAKYQRRIERFRQLKKHKKVIFMRYATCPEPWTTTSENRQTAIRLKNALNSFFDNKLDFVLVMLGGDDYYKVQWNIKDIRNYYVSAKWHDVASEVMKQNFIPIFKDLGIL